jgi:hypothetical protein
MALRILSFSRPLSYYLSIYFFTTPFNKDSTKSTINIKKTILAIPAAAPAIPPNPRMAAMIAIITNVIVQRNIFFGFKLLG